jgi:ParB family chromosome partitioning protein
MSAGLGVDITNIGKALSLARLPKEVLNAFSTPLDLQYRWATNLNAALQKEPDAVLTRAKEIQTMVPRPNSKEVLALLLEGVVRYYPPHLRFHSRVSLDKSGRLRKTQPKN